MSSEDYLTYRQLQVARLIADGLTNEEIAYRLRISPHTAKFHADNARRKLRVNSRRKIAARLKELKLLE